MNIGKLIVVDGTDGSGKATQTKLLVEALTKLRHTVRTIDFPRYKDNQVGKLLFEALKENKHGDFIAISPKIASTLYAVDRFESAPQIRAWLAQGDIVISDRYASANQIHQGGKISDAMARKEFLEWLDTLEFKTLGIPRPDVIVYLHVPLEVSLKLIHSRAVETGTKPDQAEADAKHLYESQESALKLIAESNNWIRIDCAEGGEMKSREAIHSAILESLEQKSVI